MQAIWQAALQAGLPVAFWRLPNEQTQHAIADLSGGQQLSRPELETLPFGFLVAPFDSEQAGIPTFLKADLHFTRPTPAAHWAEEEAPANYTPEQAEARAAFWQQTREQAQKGQGSLPALNTPPQAVSTEEADYLAYVQAGIEAIRRGEMRKIVPARIHREPLPEGFDPLAAFDRLGQLYPKAFVSLLALPGRGIWLGATPETLISVTGRYFHTMALAGTQALTAGMTEADARWSQKEIEEQALVSRYIIDCFKKIRLREFDEDGPRTVRAGHLLHLRTDFGVDMEATSFPLLGSVMLELLHPTSAVCGMPKQEAMAFIRRYEGPRRELYSGYLGPVNAPAASSNDTRLFVNLRCMQLLPDAALIYAGGGVTRDSIPAREWEETRQKVQVMRRLFAR